MIRLEAASLTFRARGIRGPAVLRLLAMGRFVCLSALMLALFTGALGCNRPPMADCQKVCWHVFELGFWERANLEIAKAPRTEREALRDRKTAELAELHANRDLPHPQICAENCTERGSKEQVACQLAATTFAEAKDCQE